MNSQEKYATLGIDIGSTTVKIAILDEEHNILFSDYERHFANIRETLSELLKKAYDKLGELQLHPMITGSGGLTLANHLGVPFTQEVVAVATSLQELYLCRRYRFLHRPDGQSDSDGRFGLKRICEKL